MGRIRWQSLVAAVLLGGLALGGVLHAEGEQAEDPNAGATAAGTGQTGDAAAEAEPPPLDLSRGTTVSDSTPAGEPPASDVTPPCGGTLSTEAGATQVTASGGETADEVRLLPAWSPDSGRFQLTDRQSDLSLAADADTEDVASPRSTRKPPSTTPAAPRKPSGDPAPTTLASGLPEQDQAEDTSGEPPATVGGSEPPSEQRQPTLAEYFAGRDIGPFSSYVLADTTESEPGASGGTSPAGGTDEATPDEAAAPSGGAVGVIATESGQAPEGAGAAPSLGQVLRGEAEDPQLGRGFEGASPWRSLAIAMSLVALLFVAMWALRWLRKPLGTLKQRSLEVIETIGIGPGKQIVIVEMRGDALVLGVTPHSINLLDKVPLMTLNENYQPTVNQIIEREGTASSADWQKRPSFASHLAPPLPARTYGPSGRPRVRVGELREARAREAVGVGKPAEASRGPRGPEGERAAKTELINRIRQQLEQLEE